MYYQNCAELTLVHLLHGTSHGMEMFCSSPSESLSPTLETLSVEAPAQNHLELENIPYDSIISWYNSKYKLWPHILSKDFFSQWLVFKGACYWREFYNLFFKLVLFDNKNSLV